MAMIFAATRFNPDLWITSSGGWRPMEFRGVSGSTLGILGCGSIGKAVAVRAKALGMHVVALRRNGAPAESTGMDHAPNLKELMQQSDHLIVGAPANSETLFSSTARPSPRPSPGCI